MRTKDKELEKVNSADIKRLERTLSAIDKYEESLNNEFYRSIAKVLGNILIPILEEVQVMPNIDKIETKRIRVNGIEYKVPVNFLQTFHKSYIKDPELRTQYEEKLKFWFEDKTEQIKENIKDVDSYDDLERVLPVAYALASLALSSFHKHPNMVLRDVQKLTGIAINEGSIAELGTGEGKTLSAVLPVYLQALRGKGAHVITANGYLARRDFEETLPIFEGLGLTVGFIPDDESELAEIEGKDPSKLTILEKVKLQEKLKRIKQEAYRRDITYGSKQTFAFDYLRDNGISKKEDMVQREERPGFALIDEVDDVLIDDAQVPYRIAVKTPMYSPNMTIRDLCIMQDISYDETLPKIRSLGITNDTLSYEEARYISKMFGKRDLLPDPRRYQEIAERFFKLQKVLITEDNMYGFKTGKELYEALLDEDKYNAEEIRRTYGIIFCRELGEYKISDKCYEDFLKFSYFSFQINSEVISNQERIINDKNYKEGIDYILNKTTGKIKLTMTGADKILNDKNYPDFIEDYNRYLSAISTEAASLLHYLQQAVVAHLLMKNGEDYIVEDGKIKTLKNGRIQEGSTYSNGLHQAIEIKENIPIENRTKETTASSTITQKDFYSRYDMFSGMTGTSSKSVFGEIFGKGTVEIPKHAFYSFHGRRKLKNAKEPIGVDKKDTKFTLNQEDKINLIVNSIFESRKQEPMQPVLLVVSDVDEISLIHQALQNRGINHNILTSTTSKEDEALIIARAGLPGAVTISTEMAGRGTDIKIGGDRETIIDIATQRHIRAIEKKQKMSLDFTPSEKDFLRKKVEQALVSSPKIGLWSKDQEDMTREKMSTIGLKVISCGFFRMERIDRQLEGRTGRNGISGVCERYACPSDIKRLGISSFNRKDSIVDLFKTFKRNSDGSLSIDSDHYKLIMSKIVTAQKNNEADVKDSIKNTQKLDGLATKLVEEYRDQRRKIICDAVEIPPLIEDMIEQATDAIISSYILNKQLNEQDLKVPINKSKLEIDVEAISLEVKQILGISFDPNIVIKSNINLLELRDAIIRTAKERHREISTDQDKEALLAQNDFMIANIPDILEHTFMVRRLTSMSVGMEGQVDYVADMEFNRSKQRLILESCKQGARCTMGLPLTIEEFKKLEAKKRKLYSMTAKKMEESSRQYEVSSARYEENNVKVIDRFRAIKKKVDQKNKKDLANVEKKIEKAEAKGKPIDVKELYSNLVVRPMKFISAIVNGREIVKLVIVRERKQQEEGKGISI